MNSSKRIVTTATLAAAALAGITVSTNAQADELTNNNGVKAQQNAQAPWQTKLNQAQQRVTSAQDNLTNANSAVSAAQGNVTSAQGQLTSAQNAASAQQAVVYSAQTNVNSASAAASSARQNLAKAKTSASPAEIAKTKQAITDQSKQVQADQMALNTAKSAAAESNKKVNTAKDQVATVTNQQSAQQAAVASAKQSRDQANSALSDAKKQTAESQNTLTTAQQGVATAKDGIKTAETALTNAQQAKDVATKDVTNGKSKVQAADAAVKSSQDNQQQVAAQVAATNTKLSQDRAALETASQAVTAAKQGVKQAQDNIVALQNALPMFNFTSEQIATTKALAQEIATDIANYQYLGTYTIQNANAFQNWANAMTNSQIQSDLDMGRFNDYFKQIASTYNNWTDNLQKDRDETVNLKNVTADQANELSIFTADLLNKIANQLGISGIVSKEVATVGASELANEVVKLCEKDGKSDGHYIYALHQAYYDHGLANTPASDSEKNTMGENDYGESLSTYFSSNLSSEMSMAEVKQQLVQGIAGMLFVDKGSMMGHAISMCGLDNIYNANKEQVIGVAPSFVETNDDNALSFHINQPQSDLLDSANSKQAGITTPLQTGKPSDGKAELAQAQATLAAKEKDAAAKQTAVDEDNTELTQLNK